MEKPLLSSLWSWFLQWNSYSKSSVTRKVNTKRVYMEMEISCLTVLARGSKIVSVYMVYLQGISHQFEMNVINAFYNKFWNQFGKFFKGSCFFAFGIWKKGGFAFLIHFLVVNIYWCFDDHGTWFNCSWDIFDDLFKCLRFLKGCFHAIL